MEWLHTHWLNWSISSEADTNDSAEDESNNTLYLRMDSLMGDSILMGKILRGW